MVRGGVEPPTFRFSDGTFAPFTANVAASRVPAGRPRSSVIATVVVRVVVDMREPPRADEPSVPQRRSPTKHWPRATVVVGYEPYDSRLCHLGRSLVAALTSAYGRRVCSPMPLGGLPRLKPSQRVSCTNPCTNLIPDLRVSGHLMCSACLGPMVEG